MALLSQVKDVAFFSIQRLEDDNIVLPKILGKIESLARGTTVTLHGGCQEMVLQSLGVQHNTFPN